ncbi:hypothetical protein DPQ33_16655 [Oceanidesulfovibrio indonesiensis]|uniref:Uncharacterized protein n=1 Tax=Oceanidesulfovibrio indonesiensis TaxID=54767 RepID=A0A7M3MBA3_9BACT|nr:hypothetical protein DPQ33_16655 [Oceanidesulfovibrio indonesiensis]
MKKVLSDILTTFRTAWRGRTASDFIAARILTAMRVVRKFSERITQRLPRGLEVPIIAACLVLVLAAGALALYGGIVATKALVGEKTTANPEELFRNGYIGQGLAQGMQRVDAALDKHGAASPQAGMAFISLARMLHSAGEEQRARVMFEQARAVIDTLAGTDPHAAGRCCLELAAASMKAGDFQAAEAAARQALVLSSAAEAPALRLHSLAMLGAALANAEHFDASFAAYQDAVSTAESHGLESFVEEASLRLDAARAALLAEKPQLTRAMLQQLRADLAVASDSRIAGIDTRSTALESRLFSMEGRCSEALRLSSLAMEGAEALPLPLKRVFARKAGQDMLAAMRICGDDSAAAQPIMAFLERLAVFFEQTLPPVNALRIQTLEQLTELSDQAGAHEQVLAHSARLLGAQPPTQSDRQHNGFDSLMDRDALLMDLLARMAVVESPPQDIATLAFGAWLSRRVLFPPTGVPAIGIVGDAPDADLIKEFNRLTVAMAPTVYPVHVDGDIESATLARKAHERLANLSLSIADRQASLKPLLQWATGTNDGYAGAVRALAAALPEHGGLLFFARARPAEQPRTPDSGPRVLAFLLTRPPSGDADAAYVHVLNIDPVRDVEKSLAAWQKARSAEDEDGRAAVVLGLAEVELYSMLWAPIRKAAPDLRTVWIGPSDPPSRSLSQQPYGTLPTPEGKPLSAAMHLRRIERDELLAAMQGGAAEQPAIVGLLNNSTR